MSFFRPILSFSMICFIIAKDFLAAELLYEQDVTFGSWKSKEDVKGMVKEFCDAARGDKDLKVIGTIYTQEKSNGLVYYTATTTCHVSIVDIDLMRVSSKADRQKQGLQNKPSEVSLDTDFEPLRDLFLP